MSVIVKKIIDLPGHSGAIYTLERGTEPHFFFSGSSDKFFAQWNLKSLQSEKFALQLPAIVYAICYVAEKNMLLAGTSSGSIHIVDLIEKKEIKILQHHTAPIFDIKHSPNNKCFYVASGDGNFSVCSLATLSLQKIKKISNEKIRSIDIDNNQQELALTCGDGTIRIYDLETLEEKRNFQGHKLAANVVKYHPNGKYLLSGGRDAHLNIWDAENDYQLAQSIPGHNYAIYSIVFSPDGKLFATASRDKTFKIWNAETFEFLVRVNKENFDGHMNSVNKLFWSSYKNYLISAGDDRTIMVWEVSQE